MIDSGKVKVGVIAVLLLAALAAFDFYGSFGTGDRITGASVSGALGIDLGDYPSPFVTQDGVFDAVIVVGDHAAEASSLAAADIISSLKTQEASIAVRKASEIGNAFSQNVISVGVGCANAVTSDIQSRSGQVNSRQCWNSVLTREGVGAVTLYDFGNGKKGVVVEGYTDADLRMAANVLKSYKDWQGAGLLAGGEVIVTKTPSGSVVLRSTRPQAYAITTAKAATDEILTPVMAVTIEPGWNIVGTDTLMNPVSTDCTNRQLLRTAYIYNPQVSGGYYLHDLAGDLYQFVLLAGVEVDSSSAAYVLNGAFGKEKACNIITPLVADPHGVVLRDGWSMVGIPPTWKGRKLSEVLSPGCKLEAAWLLKGGKWVSLGTFPAADQETFNAEDVGKGFWIKATNCALG